jgi:alpha-L-rhamnosidase
VRIVRGTRVHPDVRRGASQTAYQVLVASSAEKLAEEVGDLWDSGRVASKESIQVVYAGKPLRSRMECHWKVRIWDHEGKPSAYSRPALWSMGLLEASDWKAQWIGLDEAEQNAKRPGPVARANWIWYPEAKPEANAPVGDRFFRREFEVPATSSVKRAQLYFTGDNRAVRIAQHDAGAHADQLVDEEHARFEHLFVHQDQPIALRGRHDGDGHEIGGECRPWLVLELRHMAAEVGANLAGLLRRHDQIVSIDRACNA